MVQLIRADSFVGTSYDSFFMQLVSNSGLPLTDKSGVAIIVDYSRDYTVANGV